MKFKKGDTFDVRYESVPVNGKITINNVLEDKGWYTGEFEGWEIKTEINISEEKLLKIIDDRLKYESDKRWKTLGEWEEWEQA